MPSAPPVATFLVRLKPFDSRRRHVMRKYTHGSTGQRFEEAMGWYRVDAELAEYLRTVRQITTDLDSPMAFDVVTEDEAKEIDRREKRVRLRADADDPNDLTAEDLHRREGASMRRTAEEAMAPPAGKVIEHKVSSVAERVAKNAELHDGDQPLEGKEDPFEKAARAGGVETADDEDELAAGGIDPFDGIDEDPEVQKAKKAVEKARAQAAKKAAKKAAGAPKTAAQRG